MASKAWIVTHPETKMDREGRVHGNLDTPLTPTGRYRADKIGRSLKGKGIKRIHSSPRKRAHETAQAISKHTGAPVTVHQELEPWDLGRMSGAKSGAIKPLLDYFTENPDRPVPNGEPKNAMLRRYKTFTKQLKPGDAVVGHSQHALAWNYVRKGGDPAKVPMVGGKSGEVEEVSL